MYTRYVSRAGLLLPRYILLYSTTRNPPFGFAGGSNPRLSPTANPPGRLAPILPGGPGLQFHQPKHSSAIEFQLLWLDFINYPASSYVFATLFDLSILSQFETIEMAKRYKVFNLQSYTGRQIISKFNKNETEF